MRGVKKQLAEGVKQVKKRDKKNKIIDELVSKEKFKFFKVRPQAPRAVISVEGFFSKGASGSQVTLIKFSDFYCGQCQRMSQTLAKVLADKKYKNKVKLVYMPYAVFGDRANRLRKSLCAGQQRKFREFMIRCFSKRSVDSRGGESCGEELSLDMKAFGVCQGSKKAKDLVEKAMDQGSQVGVTATPTLFLNGVKLLDGSEEGIDHSFG